MLGNGMVLLVYCRKRNKLRPPELMTVNLAVCDLGFSLLGVPFFVTSRYQDQRSVMYCYLVGSHRLRNMCLSGQHGAVDACFYLPFHAELWTFWAFTLL